MHGNADCRQCGKYITEAKIGALLCWLKRVTRRQDDLEYIQFSTGHRLESVLGEVVCVQGGGEGGEDEK